MNIKSTLVPRKSSPSTVPTQTRQEQSLKQHMQDLLLQGQVSDFVGKAYHEDAFLAAQPNPNASFGEKVESFIKRKTVNFNLPGHDKWVARQFEDFQPGTPDPNFRPLTAERFIDELDHQTQRYEITGNKQRAQVFREASEAHRNDTSRCSQRTSDQRRVH